MIDKKQLYKEIIDYFSITYNDLIEEYNFFERYNHKNITFFSNCIDEYTFDLYNSESNHNNADTKSFQKCYELDDIFSALIWKLKEMKKELETDVKIYGDCKDGSGSQVNYAMYQFNEMFKEIILENLNE